MRLTNKVCLITGAGSGMGRVAAQPFASEGACAVVAEIIASGDETVRLIQDAGGEAIFVPTDVGIEGGRESNTQLFLKQETGYEESSINPPGAGSGRSFQADYQRTPRSRPTTSWTCSRVP